MPVQPPRKLTCTADLEAVSYLSPALHTTTSFPYVNANALVAVGGRQVPIWSLYKYWIGSWSEVLGYDGGEGGPLVPHWPEQDIKWSDNLMLPIAIRSSTAPKNSPFSSCLQGADCSLNPRSQGFNKNTGMNYQLLYMIEADNALNATGADAKVWKVPASLSGTGIPHAMRLLDYQWGVVDGWATGLPSTAAATAAPLLLQDVWVANRPRLPATTDVSSGLAISHCDAAHMPAVLEGVGADGREPFGTYTCGATTITPEMQYPYCVQQCGSAKGSHDTWVVPGTCTTMNSNICGCGCVGACHGCSKTLGRPGMLMGLDLTMGVSKATAKAATFTPWAPVANAVFGTPQARRLYRCGQGGGYSMGLPTFKALAPASAASLMKSGAGCPTSAVNLARLLTAPAATASPPPQFVTEEGGIVGPDLAGTPDGELHDAFYNGVQAKNWGVLLQKGAVPLNTATLSPGEGGNAVPLMDITADVVQTYRCPNTAKTKKPVVVLRSLEKEGVLTTTANLTTSRWWGSGYYEVTAKFPKVRGGVNAIWTFHGDGTSPYTNPNGCVSETAEACEGFVDSTAPTAPWGVPFGAPLEPRTQPRLNAMADPFAPDSASNQTLQRNDEIDIELPTNSTILSCDNGLPGDPSGRTPDAPLQSAAPMAWNTMNCNTYQYTGGGGDGAIPYVNMPIISDEAVVDGEKYHVYGFQWCTGHMGSGNAATGNAPDKSNPATWEEEPHVSWYLDGAYMGTINAFVPSRYSRLTIGFIQTGNYNWHGDPDDWGTPVNCAYISEVHIVPFHNDRDCWWPSPADQPINLRNPSTTISKQTWLPLAYAFAKHWQGKYAVPAIPWDQPYWGGSDTDFFGAYCDGTRGVQKICQAAFEAWKVANGIAGPLCDLSSVRDVIPRVPATYDLTYNSGGWASPCTSGLFYQCPNIPRAAGLGKSGASFGSEAAPPMCAGVDAEDPSRSQQDPCSTAAGPLVSGRATPACAAVASPGCGSLNIGTVTVPCTTKVDCESYLESKCDHLACTDGACTFPAAADGTPSTNGTYSAYCKSNSTCSFKHYGGEPAGGAAHITKVCAGAGT